MSTILFFGRVAERLGRTRDIDLPPAGLSVGELRRRLADVDPAAGEVLLRPDVRASVDRVIVRDDAVAAPGQEVAFFSVFSGG